MVPRQNSSLVTPSSTAVKDFISEILWLASFVSVVIQPIIRRKSYIFYFDIIDTSNIFYI